MRARTYDIISAATRENHGRDEAASNISTCNYGLQVSIYQVPDVLTVGKRGTACMLPTTDKMQVSS